MIRAACSGRGGGGRPGEEGQPCGQRRGQHTALPPGDSVTFSLGGQHLLGLLMTKLGIYYLIIL